MLRQLTPLVRFDGYHVLADLTGVPDLFHRIRPTLLGLLPWRWRHPEATRPQAVGAGRGHAVGAGRRADARVLAVRDGPHAARGVLGTAWASAGKQCDAARPGLVDADVLEVLARGDRRARGASSRSSRSPSSWSGSVRRIGHAGVDARPRAGRCAAALAALLAAGAGRRAGLGVVAARGQPTDRSSPTRAARSPQAAAAARPAPPGCAAGQLRHDHHRLGRPATRAPTARASPAGAGPGAARRRRHVRRRRRRPTAGTHAPRPGSSRSTSRCAPGEGDNQALAVNTTDNTVQYDVAFALVWVEDDSPA